MAAEDDGEDSKEAWDQRIKDLALQAVYKGTNRGNWSVGKGQNLKRSTQVAKVAKMQIMEERTFAEGQR